MPQATTEAAVGVRLELTDPKTSYCPGDTLNGHVVWRSPQIGFVQLRLYGRVKTKIERKHTTRGRAILFDLKEVLYNGETCSNGEQARPFSINIPTTIQENVKAVGDRGKIGIKDEWRESPDFLSSGHTTGDLPLPFSYYYNAASAGTSAEAFIEYVLQAQTAVTEGASKNEVTLGITNTPLFIRMPTTDALNKPARLMTRYFPCTIVAHSVDPDFDKSTLTFRQKMKKTFRPALFPRFSFDVRVDAPTCIQLDDTTFFPFKISLWPDLRPEWTNIRPDGDNPKLPEVRITSFKLFLRSTTLVRCPASWMDDESDKMHDYNWELTRPIDYAIPLGSTKEAPLPPTAYQAGVRALSQPLVDTMDLGTLLGLRLSPLKTEAQEVTSKTLVRPVWPSFKTFSINVSYSLIYEIGIECLGEKETIDNLGYETSGVKILPPSHDRETQMDTKKDDFDPVRPAVVVGDLARTIIQNVLL